MRFLVRMTAQRVPRQKLRATVRTVGSALGVAPKNPKWTSYGALEVDVFASTRTDFELFTSAMGPLVAFEFMKDLNISPPHKEEPELYAEARSLFNAERYWESHEALEGVWRVKVGDERRVLQGIILVCAAFVHHQRGEDEVALRVLRRASAQLDLSGDRLAGFDLELLRRDVQTSLDTCRFEPFRV